MHRSRVATLVSTVGLLAGVVTWWLVTRAWSSECAAYSDAGGAATVTAQQSVCEGFSNAAGAVFFAVGALVAMAALVIVVGRWRDGRVTNGWLVGVALLPVLLPTMQLVGLARAADGR